MKTFLKISAIVILLTGSYHDVHSQNRQIDSLTQLIKEETDENKRLDYMLTKSGLLSRINLDSSIRYSQKTLKEAKRINSSAVQQSIIQKMVANYSFSGNSKEALKYLNQYKLLIKNTDDSLSIADYYASAGLYYGMQSNYDSSIYFYKKSLSIYEKSGKQSLAATSASNLAIAYQQHSNYPTALHYQQIALKIQEGLEDSSGQAYTLVNMATTYQYMGDLKRAETTFLQSIEIAKKNNINNVELYGYSNLANLYIEKHQWQKGYDFAMEAVSLGKKMGDRGIEAASLSKAARAKISLKQLDEALELSKRSIAIADSIDQPLVRNQAYSSMGDVLKSLKRWKEAIAFYEKALIINDFSLNYSSGNASLYEDLSESYEQIGNAAKALEMHKKYTVISDSVHSRDNIQKATELTMNYEFEKKEQAEKVKQDAKDELNRTRQIGLISGLLLSLIIIVGAGIGYRGKQRANALLRKQKNEIEDTLRKLKAAQSQLIQSEKMASLGELTAGIAHEIQNPLNFVNNFSEVSNELITDALDALDVGPGFSEQSAREILKDVQDNLIKIAHHGKRADAIVKGMLQHSQSSSGIKTPTNINLLADEYLRLAYNGLRVKDKAFTARLETEFDNTLGNISIIPQDMGRVMLNLINNGFYAVKEKKKLSGNDYVPTVWVKTKRTPEGVEIGVSDNGNGIPETAKEKIFQPFFTTKPTGQGTGLGLSLSYDIIVKGHGGTLKVKSDEGQGSDFTVFIPVN